MVFYRAARERIDYSFIQLIVDCLCETVYASQKAIILNRVSS